MQDEIDSHGRHFNLHCLLRPLKLSTGTGPLPAIGEGTWIGPFTLIDGSGGLTIGKMCDISSGAQIVTHSSVRRCISERKHDKLDFRETTIGDHVFIGTSAVILMGCHIGDHCVIAAGSLVLEGTFVPPWSVVKGNPAMVYPGEATIFDC